MKTSIVTTIPGRGKSVNLTEITNGIADQQEIPVSTVHKVLKGFLDMIGLSLSAGDDVTIRRFGRFSPRSRKAVVRRNPKTGDEISVPAKTSVGFTPAPDLKARVDQGHS